MTTYDPSKNRPAHNPGGMECETCGAIFIGEEWHSECGQCHAKRDQREYLQAILDTKIDPETSFPA